MPHASPFEHEFAHAVATGDLAAVDRFLADDAALGRGCFEWAPGTPARDPLLLAIEHGQDAVFFRLFPLNDITADPAWHRRLLCAAASHGQMEMTRALLALPAQFHRYAPRQSTPLMKAAAGGHTEIVRLLVPLSPRFERDQHRHSALAHAARSGSLECVQALLPTALPLPLALARAFDRDVARTLVEFCEEAPLDTPNALSVLRALASATSPQTVFRALLGSVEKGHLDRVETLLPFCGSVRADALGRTALALAANQGHLELLRFLLPEADVNAVDEQGRNALMRACLSNRPRCVELLAPLTDLECVDRSCDDAMTLAALERHWDCAEIVGLYLSDEAAAEQLERYPTQLPQLRARLERQDLARTLESSCSATTTGAGAEAGALTPSQPDPVSIAQKRPRRV